MNKGWGVAAFTLVLIGVIVWLSISIYQYNTYYLKDVKVIDKPVNLNLSSGDYPDFFIVVKKGKLKAQLELDREDYRRIIKGQHINISVAKSSGYVRRYQLVMEDK